MKLKAQLSTNITHKITDAAGTGIIAALLTAGAEDIINLPAHHRIFLFHKIGYHAQYLLGLVGRYACFFYNLTD